MENILVILGTRPEAIKLAPVILKLRQMPSKYAVYICNTEQQKELSSQTLEFFGLKADIHLNVMQPNQTLPEVQTRILSRLEEIYNNHSFDATIVQGDTMSAFCGGLISYYNKVSVFHVEAGLRSNDVFEPFPEEALRQMLTRITDLHFAPTESAKSALLAENIPLKNIHVTGNTVIDALTCLPLQALDKAKENMQTQNIVLHDKLVLITIHRRENHGERLGQILDAITQLASNYPEHQFVLPVHPNPNVKDFIYARLKQFKNIKLTMPLDYPELVCLLKHAKLILTDSGGIQEEAPSFGVPILVLRYETERKEGVDTGFAKLVGADTAKILFEAEKILMQDKKSTRLNSNKNPYGDGKASAKIVRAIDLFWK